MKVPYYLLGLLIRFGPQHGYRLREVISQEIADFAKIKLPTIYYNLEKLQSQGYVSAVVEKDGNRPERTVYGITPKGKKHFEHLTSEILKETYEPEFLLDAVLYFLEFADIEQVTEYLQQRKATLSASLQAAQQHQQTVLAQVPPSAAFLAESIFSHHTNHLRTELEWTQTLLNKL